MNAHSTVVGGSSAARVIACPASVKLSADIPRGPASSYAMEGTACHAVMEQWLLQDEPDYESVIGLTIEGVEITQEIFDFKLMPAMAATLEAFTYYGVEEFEPEAQVHFTSIPGAFGTCDVFAKCKDGSVLLLDYKFGDGVLVFAANNKQLEFYGAAALEDPEFKDWFDGSLDQTVHLGIIQPAKEDVLNVCRTDVRDLASFTAELMIAVHSASKDGGVPHPGEHCRWCPAAAICPAKNNEAGAVLRLKDEHLNDLAVAKAVADELSDWIKQVNDMTHRALEAGQEVEGYKLVKKKAMRKWVAEDEAKTKLKNMKKLKRESYIKESLITPPQLEKVCKAKKVDFKQFAEYISMVSSGTTVAPEDDPREGIVMQADREVPEHLAKKMKP